MRGRKPSIDSIEINAPEGESLFSSADYKLLVANLKAKSETDISAMKVLADMIAAERAAEKANFVLNIVPFDIPDKKLSDIIQQADVPVVEEILSGLSIRLQADEFSTETRRTLQVFTQQFLREAERIYAPPAD